MNEVNETKQKDNVPLDSTILSYMSVLPITYRRIKKANPKIVITSSGFNDVYDGFLDLMCKFKKRYRKSDLTLWDCFPVGKFTKDMDGKGTTRILAHSEKGASIVKNASVALNLIEVDSNKLTDGVREMFKSVPMNPNREMFFIELKSMEPTEFFKKWFPVTFKVRLNAFVRLSCHRLGIYTLAKRVFLVFYKRRDDRMAVAR